MPKNKSMKYQVQQELYKKACFGQSKHEAKQEGRATEGIYSKSTMQTYIRVATQFANFCKEEYGCKTIVECMGYAQNYIDLRDASHLSSYTTKLDVSAINKLYQGKTSVVSARSRNRADITRTRQYTERSRRAEERNPEIKEFCQVVGLRREELEALRGCDIKSGKDGKVYVQVQQGKGGKFRSVEVLERGINLVKQYQSDSSEHVFSKLDRNLPIHMYRSDYAKELYNQFYNESDKPIEERNQYHCRGDRKGIVYDRDVMMRVSQNLGHNRVSVIAGHYL